MSAASPKSTTAAPSPFNMTEFLKSARDSVSKWAAFDEKTNRGSLAGKVFTSGYALIFGWFFFHTLINFMDILMPSNLALSTYFYYYGGFLISILASGIIFSCLLAILVFESMSDDEAIRWPMSLSNGVFLTGLVFSNMAGEPYPDLKSGWFGSDMRYPEFMGRRFFIIFLPLLLSDMLNCFGSIDEEASETFLFRPSRVQSLKDKQRVYDENFSGMLGIAFIYFSYIYFILAFSGSFFEGFGYFIGLRIVRSCFGRGHHFENGRKLMLFIVPVLAAVQGYFAHLLWISYGSDFVFYTRALVVLLHFVIFVGWHCNQNSWLGSICLPYTRKAEYLDFDFDAKDAKDDDDDDDESKQLNAAEAS